MDKLLCLGHDVKYYDVVTLNEFFDNKNELKIFYEQKTYQTQ